MKVEVDVLDSLSLTVPMVSVDVRQHFKKNGQKQKQRSVKGRQQFVSKGDRRGRGTRADDSG